jgi:exonuclease I
MMNAPRSRTRRAVVFAALATLLGVVSLTLSQCTMVGDNLTGVDLNRAAATTCVKQCNDLYKTLYDQEQKLYDTNKAICQGLPQPNKDACLAAELARHQAAMNQLGIDKIACQQGCTHTQGTGSAG